MKTVSVIGAGRIGRDVIAAIEAIEGYRLGRVLVRSLRDRAEPFTADAERFFAEAADLIIDTAGPSALSLHGERAVALAELWTVSAAALVDDAFRDRLARHAAFAGHRLRVIAGALGGLDGVAAAAVDPTMELTIAVERPGLAASFAGPLREAAAAFPDEINFAVAAALAGPGIDRTRISIMHGAEGRHAQHRLTVTALWRGGTFTASHAIHPLTDGELHPAAAAIIAALRGGVAPLQVG